MQVKKNESFRAPRRSRATSTDVRELWKNVKGLMILLYEF